MPVIIAIDGRSGAGKTSLALELTSLLRKHREVSLFHLEDIYPGWNGLVAGVDRYVQTVLTPLSQGLDAEWVSWDWEAHFDGEARCTAAAPIVIIEGVGAAQLAARELLDVVIWVAADDELRKQRALSRDGETYAPYWELWSTQEEVLLAKYQPVHDADIVLNADGPAAARPADTLAALGAIPELGNLLAPELLQQRERQIVAAELPFRGDTLGLFNRLFGRSRHAVWLDSSDAAALSGRNRFSIMADDGGASGQLALHSNGLTRLLINDVEVRLSGPFFSWLDRQWSSTGSNLEALDTGFQLGWLGYLGYELKRESGGSDHSADTPDAALIFAGRAVVIDHQEHLAWALSFESPEESAWWLEEVREAIKPTAPAPDRLSVEPIESDPGNPKDLALLPEAALKNSLHSELRLRDSEANYQAKVSRAQQQITEGNSYEVCLTTALDFQLDADPLALYALLRRANPAPFASFLRFDELAVLSTSPERFLSISATGGLKAEPIKGTRRRDQDPMVDRALRDELANSAKDRAENVMIVDLMRNDLSRLADPESVKVSRLCDVESYASVHQLVSTIEAQLSAGASRAEAVAVAFPAGSMTGAPKISTMHILDELEAAPRGVYSGAIGYFSRDGSCDLSVVIRTLVLNDGQASLGVGGAITSDSDPEAEWDEVRAKAFGVLNALGLEFPEG